MGGGSVEQEKEKKTEIKETKKEKKTEIKETKKEENKKPKPKQKEIKSKEEKWIKKVGPIVCGMVIFTLAIINAPAKPNFSYFLLLCSIFIPTVLYALYITDPKKDATIKKKSYNEIINELAHRRIGYSFPNQYPFLSALQAFETMSKKIEALFPFTSRLGISLSTENNDKIGAFWYFPGTGDCIISLSISVYITEDQYKQILQFVHDLDKSIQVLALSELEIYMDNDPIIFIDTLQYMSTLIRTLVKVNKDWSTTTIKFRTHCENHTPVMYLRDSYNNVLYISEKASLEDIVDELK